MRKTCAVCGKEKRRGSFSGPGWSVSPHICDICRREEAGGEPSERAIARRRDVARQTYCHRWRRETLMKSCRLYPQTCGEVCYREGPDRKPNCFVEPEEREYANRPAAINYDNTAKIMPNAPVRNGGKAW